MKSIWTGFCVAFSLYSAIPVPQVAWEKKTMRWALSFLPLVGVLVGGAELLWFWFCRTFGASALLYAILAGLLPLVITGGIHMDGLTDTCDALCSFGEKEKKLEILKDPHVGAFGPMWLMAFLLAQTALFAQLYETPALLPLAALAFPLARALGARKIVTMTCAKNTGLAHLFAEGSDKHAVALATAVETVLGGALLLMACVRFHGSMLWALIYLAALAVWNAAHRRMCMNIFGGLTGDLAGFFISTAELLGLAMAALGGLIG